MSLLVSLRVNLIFDLFLFSEIFFLIGLQMKCIVNLRSFSDKKSSKFFYLNSSRKFHLNSVCFQDLGAYFAIFCLDIGQFFFEFELFHKRLFYYTEQEWSIGDTLLC